MIEPALPIPAAPVANPSNGASRRLVAMAAVMGALGFVAAWWLAGMLRRSGFYGYLVISDVGLYKDYGDAIARGLLPYRDLPVDYPPGALPAFILPSIPASGGGIQAYVRAFEALMMLCGAVAVGFLVASLGAVGATGRRLALATGFAALAPLVLGPVVFSHYDLWPAAVTAGSLAAVLMGRPRWGLAGLGFAFVVKVYPLVTIPLAIGHVWATRGRREAAIAGAIAAAVAAAVLVPFLVLAPDGILNTLHRQLSRPLQVESLGASIMLVLHVVTGEAVRVVGGSGSQNVIGALGDPLSFAQTGALAISLLAILAWFARAPRDRERLIRASAAAVVAYVAFGRVLSPQYLVWLIFLVPLAAGSWGVIATAAVGSAAILTQLWFPARYFALVQLDPSVPGLVLARDLLLVAAAGALFAPWDRAWGALTRLASRARGPLRAWLVRVRGMRPQTALALVLLIALLARVIWLWLPAGSLIFDESYYVNVARVLLGWHVPDGAPYANATVGFDPNTEHPPLGKLLIAGSMLIFGDNGVGWRMPSVLTGMLALACVYGIVRAAGESPWLGVLATAIYSLDILSFIHGRVGTLDMMSLGLVMVGVLMTLRRAWIVAGVAFAIGALIKETAAFAVMAVVIMEGLLVLAAWRRREPFDRQVIRQMALLIGSFTVVALGGLWLIDLQFTTFTNPLQAVSRLLGYGIALTGGSSPNGINSNPWDWLVNNGQFDYLKVAVNDLAGGKVVGTHPVVEFRALLNPALVGTLALAVPFGAWLAWKVKSRVALWGIVWIVANYLPFYALAIVSHRVMYFYYILPAVPAFAVLTALLLARSGLPRAISWAYLGGTVVAFVAYFPFRQIPR